MLKYNRHFLLLFSLTFSFSITAQSTMSREQLSEFLRTAKVIKIEKTKLGITKPKRITLEKNNIQRRAIFKSYSQNIKFASKRIVNSADRFENDMAAYKLDQLLGLNMIPVSTIRKVNNKLGLVQDWVENSIVYKQVYDNKSNELDACALKKQNAIMYVFDILIYNDDRNVGNQLYTLSDCRLWMIDHSRSFRIKRKTPKALKHVKIRMSQDFALKLKSLNTVNLKSTLSDYINATQIRALLRRRDYILQIWKRDGELNFLEG